MIQQSSGSDPDGESLLRAKIPAETMVRLHERKIRTGETIESIVNEAVTRYLAFATEASTDGSD